MAKYERIMLKNVRTSYNKLIDGDKKEVKTKKKLEDGSEIEVLESTTVWGVQLLLPKTETTSVKVLDDAIDTIKNANKSVLQNSNGVIPKSLKVCKRDGDEDDAYVGNPVYKGMWVINCSSYKKPGVVIRTKEGTSTAPANEIYSGCWGWAVILVKVFENKSENSKGINATICNFLKTKNDTRLDGFVSAEDEFADADVVSELSEDII